MTTIVNDIVSGGKTYIITNHILGKGSYGHVYKAIDDKHKSVAIKCCKINEFGMNNLLECSLMRALKHPYLNDAIDIVASKKMLYIIQPMAICDLHHYTSMHQQNHQCSVDELKIIFHSLLQAVAVLHSQHIIHGDIKASNVLLFDDNSIKLTDFTLATKKTDEQLFVHTVATATHRPPEVFLKTGFDLSVDTWCLGVTLYEITYQELLFKNQLLDKMDKKTLKEFVKQTTLNAISDWCHLTKQTPTWEKYTTTYHPVVLSPRYTLASLTDINNIIESMLKIDIKQRPTALQLLKNPFFSNLTLVNPTICLPISNKIESQERARVTRYLQQFSIDQDIQQLAWNLYTKLTLSNKSEYDKALAVSWVSLKLLTGNPVSLLTFQSMDYFMSLEKDIAHNLGFRLFI